ncbi:MAG: SLBB domain-containing protein, partial [Kofleriaceae bacterium]
EEPVDPLLERSRDELMERIKRGNPYRLGRTGYLDLPGVGPIVIAGLTEKQATQRLNTDARLEDFVFVVTLLPIEEPLKPFGYDLFVRPSADGRSTTTGLSVLGIGGAASPFAPETDVPVPAEYVLGPGDVLEVQLIGENGGQYTLPVNRDGSVDFPDLGPIRVAGMRFEQARSMIERRVADQLIGTRASVTMGELRSMRVFVLGEANRPGSYTVTGMSTITNALYMSGGVSKIGSLRNIELKRNGQTVRKLDLYDLLLNGDNSNDMRLMPGDVVFIPPVGTTVAITGEVRRPAIYELAESAPASDILYLAGGLTPEADPRGASVERIDQRRNRTMLDLDFTSPEQRRLPLVSGDFIRVPPIRNAVEGGVLLEGHVHRPGPMQYRAGMRLSDLIPSAGELQPSADLGYVLIRREIGPERRVSVLSADLGRALAAPGSAADAALAPRDRVIVFDLATSRERIIAPIVEELRRQSGSAEPSAVVSVSGRIKVAGEYPLETGMTVSDLVRAGGGLDEAAYVGEAELTRYEVVNGDQRQTELIRIDIAKLMAGDPAADVALRPFDFLVIKEVPQWGKLEFVTIEGEVRFPGVYPIQRGETLKSVIARAGGLTDLAFVEGAVFTRKELQERERKQLMVLADRLQREIASLSLQQSQSTQLGGGSSDAMAAGQSLLTELRASKPVGRLVLDLDRVMAAAKGSPTDIVLKDGDRLAVPRQTQEVTVIGEVQNATSHLFEPRLSRDDYLQRSGGLTQRADDKRIFIVRANGSVAGTQRDGWFRRGGDASIRPGDTIVAPLDAERMRPLSMWQAVTQIVYNLAIAAAAVNSF